MYSYIPDLILPLLFIFFFKFFVTLLSLHRTFIALLLSKLTKLSHIRVRVRLAEFDLPGDLKHTLLAPLTLHFSTRLGGSGAELTFGRLSQTSERARYRLPYRFEVHPVLF